MVYSVYGFVMVFMGSNVFEMMWFMSELVYM